MKRVSQRGVALVVTLIMLSVITVMTVAFLALARRERAAVATSTYMTDSKLMVDVGLERAKGMIVARVLSTTNFVAPDLMVSRTHYSPGGFNPGALAFETTRNYDLLTNVNYDYTISGAPLNGDQRLRNIANLYYDPRPPVFVKTNGNGLDFRFFLDLNRNRAFETNGWWPELNAQGNRTGTNLLWLVGDPEWVGVLEQPRFPHSRTNMFLGRYAFLVLPIGRSLDLNFIHNQAKDGIPNIASGYYRNQGFGSWELNLAGFLADLNTNVWGGNQYDYNTNTAAGSSSTGRAFDHAHELLNYRYRGSPANLAAVTDMFPPRGAFEFLSDMIDGYANGSPLNLDNDRPDNPWPGADSLAHFFSIHDFWRVPTTPNYYTNFINTLADVSSRRSTYDRYTFYRMISQLSTDSGTEAERAEPSRLISKIRANLPNQFPPEPVGKINLNYDNFDYPASEFVPWEPVKFFTNVANILLRSRFDFGLTNIMVAPTNFYTPAVHRILQVTANICDATTNSPFPSVFRPIFGPGANPGEVYIRGYYADNRDSTVDITPAYESYGVPFIVGAKKGIPNFNEYVMQTYVQAARKLEVTRPDTKSAPTMTNQMFLLSISNLFALESWNSYTQAFPRDVFMRIRNDVTLLVTNTDGLRLRLPFTNVYSSTIPADQWAGFDHRNSLGSFRLPVYTNVSFLSNHVYRVTGGAPRLDPIGQDKFEELTGGKKFNTPTWGIVISNRLTYILSHRDQILDYVHLRNLDAYMDMSALLTGQELYAPLTGVPSDATVWKTNKYQGSLSADAPTIGIVEQLEISRGNGGNITGWNNYALKPTKPSEMAFFDSLYNPTNRVTNTALRVQAPFTPARRMAQKFIYQANDPLVHHMVEHLRDNMNSNPAPVYVRMGGSFFSDLNLTNLNERYRPWGGGPRGGAGGDKTEMNYAVKDPGILKSDDWDFPTNKFPSIGWLGRVHRGTPWQTIYLKAQRASDTEWRDFIRIDPGLQMHPVDDWRLIDMFTVAPHPNATHGQLSINQTNLAAWSAVLSGITVYTNFTPLADDPLRVTNGIMVIEPNSPQLLAIVEGINRTRRQLPGQTFRRLGDLLAVPELTITSTNFSPFLTLADNALERTLSDTAIERIPQQILSLLKVGDARFVIYAFGQSLKPAENSIVTSGSYVGMCTNYQITGEVVSRTVLRFDGNARDPRPVVESYNLLPVDD